MARKPRPRARKSLNAALGLCLGLACQKGAAARPAGATLPWHTYEAEAMQTNGTILGPSSEPNTVENESSGLRCVKFTDAGQHVQFQAEEPANTLIVRYSLPDSQQGGGLHSKLGLYINGRRERLIDVDSHYSWIYGKYPFSNDPAQGKPRNFYDEARVVGLSLKAGDLVRIQWEQKDTTYCILDLVDLEEAAPPLTQPSGSIPISDFGGEPGTDATEPLRKAVAAAQFRGGVVWVPAGTYTISGDIVLPSHVTVQGAGLWHTTFAGNPELYGQADRRVRFRLKGTGIILSDFAIVGRLNYRNDQEPNDGIVGAGCEDGIVRRVWIEHTKVGLWIYNGVHLKVQSCRFRDTLADGINLCVGAYGNVVEDCSARGTGDDCFAMWPAPSDQGFADKGRKSGENVFRHCTGQLPFLANGGAIYGGHNNRIEDCVFTDITAGCGVLLSTTFPTADAAAGIDNNFSGETVIKDCILLRCGGFDHEWGLRGSVQIAMDKRSIAGLRISGLTITDSLSDGITVVAPGMPGAHGTLTNSTLSSSTATWDRGTAEKHRGLWVQADAQGELQLKDDSLPNLVNEAAGFKLTGR